MIIQSSLPKKLYEKIEKDLALEDQQLIDELNNLCFEYIDLNRKSKEQRNCLKGKCTEVFGKSIPDPEAAIDTLMKVFRKVELTYNQGNITRVLDETKKVFSREIDNAFDLITSKANAYDTWREQQIDLSTGLCIPISQRSDFQTEFENCIDYFKDLNQIEHNKILLFVKNNRNLLDEYYDHARCVVALYDKYMEENTPRLDGIVIKAAIFAAYVKVVN